MSTYNENKSSNFLRTQSYIANGMPNPTFKTSKKDYLSSLIRNKFGNKTQTQHKSNPKINKSKNYINDVKKKKKNSSKKPSQKKLLKKYINDKVEEKTEIINHKNNNKNSRNTYLYNTKTEKFKNIDENYLYSKTHHYNVKGNNKKESKGKENNKNAMNVRNKRNNINKNNGQRNEINKSNGLHKSNTFTNNVNDQFFAKTTQAKNNYNFDFENIIKQTNLGIMTTRANIRNKRNKQFNKDIDNIYSMTYRSKLKQNPKLLEPGKVKNFIHKILSNDNDEYLDIKNQKNKNTLLNKFIRYTQREKVDFEDKNKTQRGLLTIKNLINRKIMIYSPKSTTNKMYNIPTNLFHNSYSNYKLYHENLNNFSKKSNSRNKEIVPVLTEYNVKHRKKNDSSNDLSKIKISKSISNLINSIREKRKTIKFIKELNNNKQFGNNSNKHIRFTFSSDKDDDSSDEFYSPNKSKNNNKKKIRNNKRINYFIKKNISSDNFSNNYKKKNNKINYNTINIRINHFINAYNEKKHFVMPANNAIN